jgi:hypothetical protein
MRRIIELVSLAIALEAAALMVVASATGQRDVLARGFVAVGAGVLGIMLTRWV